jgi:hypothetical protein
MTLALTLLFALNLYPQLNHKRHKEAQKAQEGILG